jgi:hypothetical protein
MRLRKLNDLGLEQFEAWIEEGADGAPPLGLITDPATSSPVTPEVRIPKRTFGDRYELGLELVQILSPFEASRISNDRYLWTTLALIWFDQLCPPFSTGRKVDRIYRYVLSSDYRHYYRHLVPSPWQLVRDHGENSRLFLLPSKAGPYPLRTHGEVLEQLGGRQSVLRSQSLISEANRLYSDHTSGRPRRGVAGSGRGSVRRLALVLRQLDLTFDVEKMPDGRLLAVLPQEFDRWQAKKVA